MIVDSTQYSGLCECGKAHSMETIAAIIEADSLSDFEIYMEKYEVLGKRCALYGSNAYKATEGKHPKAEQTIVLNSDGLHADENSTSYVLSHMEKDVDVILAIGSGTIHDISRFCAKERNIKFVSIPTAASVDGFCSTVAAMTWEGFKKTMPSVAPIIVIADTDVIKNAPKNFVRSGVGDIIAKFTALADWKIANILTSEHFCKRIYDIMHDAAVTVVESIPDILQEKNEAYEKVMYGLIMSGIAMQMMGNSRPASGAEHHISHMIEIQPEAFPVEFITSHGEKTGVGSIIVSEEYHRLANKVDIRPYLKEYKDITENEIRMFFGDKLADAICDENKIDCLKPVTPELLATKWSQIRSVINEIPTAEEIHSVLETIGAKRCLSDIGVAEEMKEILLYYSPLIRRRLTLMRVRRLIKEQD